MKNRYLYFLVFLLIVSGSYLLLKSTTLKHTQRKPKLIVKYINQWDDFRLDQLQLIIDPFREKYKIVNDQKTEDYDLIIDGPFGTEKILNNKAIKIYFTGEAFLPNLKDYDLVIGFDLIEADNYVRVPLYYLTFQGDVSTFYKRPGNCNPNKPYFACFLVTNGGNWGNNGRNNLPFDGCTKRNRLFHLLSLYKEVKSGGKYLNNIGDVVPSDKTQEWLGNCKFTIAYENQTYNGYITEKPFQAYFTGSVPIYYADPTALEDINTKSIISANNFANENDLVEYIKKVDQDDELYCNIWNQKISIDPDKNFEVIKEKLRIKLEKIIQDKLEK